jgi:hypothetical protein
MRVDTRFFYLPLILVLSLIIGCSSGGDGPSNPAPDNQSPTIILVSHPGAAIQVGDPAVFLWRGQDAENELSAYYVDAMAGSFTATSDTTATYTSIPEGTNYTFRVFATDADGAHSDTVAWTFSVISNPLVVMGIAGQGLVDDDGDGFWTQFRLNWSPVVDLNSATTAMRLLVGVQLQNGGPETLDSSDLVNRSPGEDDTLYFTLPNTFTKNIYRMRAELHDASSQNLITPIPYGAISSMNNVHLEDIDGTIVWIADADTSNGVDALAPFGHYESIEIWVNADAYGDEADVRLVLYERTSMEETLGQEHIMSQDLYGQIEGIGTEDMLGWHLTALSAPDVYDYRIELRDHFTNELLDQMNYGENPQLMNVPLGISTTSPQPNRVERIVK